MVIYSLSKRADLSPTALRSYSTPATPPVNQLTSYRIRHLTTPYPERVGRPPCLSWQGSMPIHILYYKSSLISSQGSSYHQLTFTRSVRTLLDNCGFIRSLPRPNQTGSLLDAVLRNSVSIRACDQPRHRIFMGICKEVASVEN